MARPPSGSLYAAARGMYPACPLFDFQGSAKNKKISLISLFILGVDSQDTHRKFFKNFSIFRNPRSIPSRTALSLTPSALAMALLFIPKK